MTERVVSGWLLVLGAALGFGLLLASAVAVAIYMCWDDFHFCLRMVEAWGVPAGKWSAIVVLAVGFGIYGAWKAGRLVYADLRLARYCK